MYKFTYKLMNQWPAAYTLAGERKLASNIFHMIIPKAILSSWLAKDDVLIMCGGSVSWML